jgi:hypothetical protein
MRDGRFEATELILANCQLNVQHANRDSHG